MRTLRPIAALPLVFTLTFPASALAQERHIVNPTVLSETIASHVAQQDADRAEIHEALNRPGVRDIARKSGIDLDRISASIDTLSGSSLEDVAAAAQRVNRTLVGGASTVTISSTTIIIALLVIILIIVAVH
jgi:hypothetical protein